MDKKHSVIGLHISTPNGAESGDDHIFTEVFDLADGQRHDPVALRFKGKGGFKDKVKPDSMASEYVIYAPISQEAMGRFKDLASFLLQIQAADPDILKYESHKKLPTNAQDVLYDDSIDGLSMNCMGVVILGCLVSGIDLKKLLDHENHNGNSFSTSDLSEVVWDADSDIIDGQSSVVSEDYNIFAKDSASPRVFATSNSHEKRGPADAFKAVAKRPDLLELLERSSALGTQKAGLPPAIIDKANNLGIKIPSSLM